MDHHRSLANPVLLSAKQVASGSILDYEVEKCLDDDNKQRCSTPFLVSKSTCYNLSWKTDGALSHTTIEVRDAGSNEIVYFRDTDGEWTPEKGEVSGSSLAEMAMFASVAGLRASMWRTYCRSVLILTPVTARLRRLQAQGLQARQQDCRLRDHHLRLKSGIYHRGAIVRRTNGYSSCAVLELDVIC